MKNKFKIIFLFLSLLSLFVNAQNCNNVTVQSTIPLKYLPNQEVYPNTDSIIYGWIVNLNGVENYSCAMFWAYDANFGTYRQKTVYLPINNNSVFISVASLGYSTLNTVLTLDNCSKVTDEYNRTVYFGTPAYCYSNVFTMTLTTVPIYGGSVNLGIAPCPPNCTNVTTPTTSPTTPVKGKKK